jgi:hypothetical protein
MSTRSKPTLVHQSVRLMVALLGGPGARSEVTRPAARRDDAGFEWRELVAGPVEQDEVGVGVPNRAQPTANHHPSRLGESTSSRRDHPG